MNQAVKFSIVVWVMSLSAISVLAATPHVAEPEIGAVMPEADSFSGKKIDGIDYYEAFKGGKLIGYCIKAAGDGYNGPIQLIVGVDLNGVIMGVEVIEHSETPGLGARVKEIKPGEKQPWFLRQFIGKNASEAEVNKNIDAITGATISSRAVTETVNKAVTEFLKSNARRGGK
jgi:electron transport complex protein RnfG